MKKGMLKRDAIILALSLATFVMALSMLALSPVTNDLMTVWQVSFSQVEWLTTIFLLVMCISMLVSPWLFREISFRRLILALLGAFMLGTLLLALTPWYFLALVGRILEAAALGVMFPLYQSALLVLTSRPNQGKVMGIAGAVMSLAIVGGSAIIELALTIISWQCFYVLLVFILALTAFGTARWVTNIVPVQRRSFDWRSLLYSCGILGLLYVINTSWVKRENLMLTVLSISGLLLIAFFRRQLVSSQPLLQVRVLRYGWFDLYLLLSGASYASLVGLMTLLPLFYRQILAEQGLKVSLALLVPALFLVCANLATSRLSTLRGKHTVIIIGMVLLAGSFLLFAIASNSLTVPRLIIISCLTATGTGLVMMPATTRGAAMLPTSLLADGITIITITRQLLGSLGTALLTLLLVLAPGKAGFVRAFCLFALIDLVVLGILILVVIGDHDNENNEN